MRRAAALLAWLALVAGCTKLDPLPGAYYPCHRDGGARDECPGEWHCGLEARCLPNDAGAWQCEADEDCFGWHCGLGADDRSPGACHDPSVAAPYRCRTDSHCEQGWRCGPDGVCLDTGAEALRPNAENLLERVASDEALWTGRPTSISISEPFMVQGCTYSGVGASANARVIDVVTGSELVKLVWMTGQSVCLPDGGTGVRMATVERVALPAGIDVVQTASLFTDTLALERDGGLTLLVVDGGVLTSSHVGVPFAATRLKHGIAGDDVFAFNDSAIARVKVDGAQWWAVDAGRVQDVAEAPANGGLARDLFVGSPRGLFRLDGDGGLHLVETRTGECRAPGDYLSVTFEIGVGSSAFVLVTRESPTAYTWRRFAEGDSGTPEPGCETLGGHFTLLESSLGLWFDGTLVASYSKVESALGPLLIIAKPDGGVEARPAGFSVEQPSFPGSREVVVSRAGQKSVVFGDARGHAWSATSAQALPFTAVTLSHAPRVLAGSQPRFATSDAVPFLPGLNVEGEQVFQHERGIGFVALPSGLTLRTSVANAPSWVVSVSATGTTFAWDIVRDRQRPLPIASFDGPLPSPLLAARHDTPDGGTIMVVTSHDRVLTADVTERVQRAASAPTLRPVLVPLPSGPISSLAVSPGVVPGASHVQAFVVANGRLFRVRADNPVVWKSDELDLGPAEVAMVWADGDRTRVALRDGTVLSLPSRVRLAPSLPGQAVLVDLVGRCGNVFALGARVVDGGTEGALFRLVADGGSPLGAWQASGVVSATPEELALGKLYDDGTSLHLVTAQGRSEVLRATCSP